MAQYRYSLKEMVLKIRSIYKDTIAEIYIGARSLRSVTCEIDALRRQCGQSSDVLTSTQTFLASTWRWNTFPVGVLLRRGAALYGAALLHGRTKFWLPTGVLKAGHLCGRGAAIARSADRPAVLEIAARVLIRKMCIRDRRRAVGYAYQTEGTGLPISQGSAKVIHPGRACREEW